MKNMTHIVVDMLYDFIDGTLACLNAENAINESIKYINAHPEQKVLYVCDCHPINHCSFKENGGIWPIHCVEGTRGGSIHRSFYEDINNISNRPNPLTNIFYKGKESDKEQYSGFEAKDINNKNITNQCDDEIVISGIASEYCIKESSLDFSKSKKVAILKNGIAYVDLNDHKKTIKELEELGINYI
jgi:nicotinamidase-related amidase